ncbi:MAG: hypothetical protein R3C62_21595 [Chloroflexota bacterium]
MTRAIPVWTMRSVTAVDRTLVQQAQAQNRLQIEWPEDKAARQWAKAHGWPTPWFSFQEAFIGKLLENDETFALALAESGIVLHIPIQSYTLSVKQLQELDALYTERSDSGRPLWWEVLVLELREIRRAVEAGVKIKIEGTDVVLTSWQTFYDWAHGRYHTLEDGADRWIGNDD